MLNSNYSSNPFDTTRPKSFFGDRKRLYVEEITRSGAGMSYNPFWNANTKPTVKQTSKISEHHASLLMISSWAFNACILLVSFAVVS